jgi:large conductance mechanosensitive channel
MTNPDPIKKIAESSFMKEFREFINRGNVMDLAIGVAVGGAFTAIVKSLVDDMIMPITSLLAGGLDFSTLSLDIPNIFGANSVAHIAYGNFLQNVVNFLIIAFTIFIIVRLINRMNRKHDKDVADAKNEAKAEATKKNSKG